jgi:hypothetical protein
MAIADCGMRARQTSREFWTRACHAKYFKRTTKQEMPSATSAKHEKFKS